MTPLAWCLSGLLGGWFIRGAVETWHMRRMAALDRDLLAVGEELRAERARLTSLVETGNRLQGVLVLAKARAVETAHEVN